MTDINRTHQLDLLLLAETWLKKNNEHRVKIPGYSLVCSHRKCKRGGGVGILVASKLQYRERIDLSLNIPDFESVTIEIKTHNDSIFVCALYRPPNTNEKDFNKNYKRLLKKFTQKQLDQLILGSDHNMDFLKHEKHVHTRDFIETNLNYHLLPTITKPTRITRSTSTLIDNIFIGRKYQGGYTSNIGISDISDHLPLLLNIQNLNPYKKSVKQITTRKLDAEKMKQINDRMKAENWEELLHHKNTNESFTIFHNTLHKHIDDIAPIKTFKIPPNRILKDDWMTPGLLKCTQKQKKLYKATLLSQNNEKVHNIYKTYRNNLTKILRKAKELHYQIKCIEFKNNTKKLWQMINRICNKASNKVALIEYLKVGQIEVHNAKEISNEFAKYFSTVGKTYATKIGESTTNINSYIKNIPKNPTTIYLDPTDNSEIITLIHRLPKKTSKGHDDISNVMLKSLHLSLVSPLTIIFNRSINEGSFPDLMKYADVVPLYKSKEHYLTDNCSPITLLITVSKLLEKLLEKVMYKRVYNFLTTTDQLYVGQYGFRQQHSCENAICELVSAIVKNQEQRKPTIGVFLDLSKAFDTLSHKILLQKLNKYGIRGKALEWFTSYLCTKIKCHSLPYQGQTGTQTSCTKIALNQDIAMY